MGKLFVFFIVGMVVATVSIFFLDTKSLANEVQAIASVITSLTILVGFYQILQSKKTLKANHNWNRRQFALQECNRIMKEIKTTHDTYDDKLKYTERKINEPYLVDADDGKTGIHDLILDKDGQGNRIKSKDGREIVSAIKSILNNYEYLASGISESTFDENTVKKLNKSNMIKAYKVFELYIEHLRLFYGRPKLFIELEKIAKKWTEEDKEKQNNRKSSEDEV